MADGKQEQLSDRGYLLTEQSNPASQDLDQRSALEIVDIFTREDAKTVAAIAQAREPLAAAIERTAAAIAQGGRLFYIGAGTSGRLGVLDAAECPPTFCTPPELVQGILAGGKDALVRSSEGLEDRPDMAQRPWWSEGSVPRMWWWASPLGAPRPMSRGR